MSQLTWTTIHLTSTFPDVPSTPGVYQFVGKHKPIYIGKSVNLRARLRSHYQNTKLDQKERKIWENAVALRYTVVDNDFMAILLESELIKKYQPIYNLITKDDTSLLYIVINLHHKFPKPLLIRARDLVSHDKAIIFGPFPSRQVAEELLKVIRHLIPFCTSKGLGKRACFYSHLGLCDPCPNSINSISIPADQKSLTLRYRHQLRQVVKILSGNTTPVISELTSQMKRLSQTENYDEALRLRDKIDNFQYWIDNHSFSDTRPFQYNQSQERFISLKKLLQSYLQHPSLHRIECYDASNLVSGTDTVSLVVLIDGKIDKSAYRRFKIKNPRANSDFARLEEALTRRFHNTWPLPDLIVLDGGKPQVRMARRVLDQLPYPPDLIGLAKNPDRLIISHANDYLTLSPPLNHPGFSLLKLLRDESHRFANSYRKVLEKQSMYN